MGIRGYVGHQAYYSLLNRDYEWELLPLGRDQGVGALIWSPLGWGKLTGKIRRGPAGAAGHAGRMTSPAPGRSTRRSGCSASWMRWMAWREEAGKTIPQVALNWLLRRPTVANVIIGARNEAQLVENIGAVGWALTPAQVAVLDEASATTPAYPVWHQRGFPMLNERGVA